MIFEASASAGELELKLLNGKHVTYNIIVLDFAMWQQYQKLAETEAARQAKAKAAKTDEERARYAADSLESVWTQLQMLVPDLNRDDLNGFSLGQVKDILEHCVSKASGAIADVRTPDQKKTGSVQRLKSSRSQGKVSRSRRSK